MTPHEAAKLALALPESVEMDHHGFPSFRVRGKIFATLPDEAHLNVMVEEPEIDRAVAMDPTAFAALFWGRRQRGVRVHLQDADRDLVSELLEDAWGRKAPRELLARWHRRGAAGADRA